MAGPIDPGLLCRRWVHSREEDTATEQVYRPAEFPLPPSRGRAGLEFGKDGTFKRISIGATDISRVKRGTWRLENADKVRIEVDGEQQVLEIRDLNEDRMAIKRVT